MDRTLPVRHEILIRKILIVKILTLSSLFYDTGNFLAQFGYIFSEVEFTPSPRVTRILVPEKHRVMRKPC